MNFTTTAMNAVNATTVPSPSPSDGYLDALQVCGAILTMVMFGFFWRALDKVGSSRAAIHAYNQFMFLVGIPCLVFRGLALQNFGRMPWRFIAVFFCLRIALFVIWLIVEVVIFRRKVSYGFGSTWINTVIFGIPIYVALFGPQFVVYPIFASISSFFFQLPIQLILFEATSEDHHSDKPLEKEWELNAFEIAHPHYHDPVLRIVLSIVLNPVLIAIVAGILFSLTGWKLPLYLDTFCNYCGTAVTPLAAFAIGVFMYRKHRLGRTAVILLIIQLTIKTFAMPLLAMPFLLAFDIEGIPRTMGVLMAALPVALSCYVLSVRYDSGVELAALNVMITTILLLPTQLMWIAILESMGWY